MNNTPLLKPGLLITTITIFDGDNIPLVTSGQVTFEGVTVIRVNEVGKSLLEMANGKTTVDEMIESLSLEDFSAEVAMFFVKLGQSGFLQEKFEVEIYKKDNPRGSRN